MNKTRSKKLVKNINPQLTNSNTEKHYFYVLKCRDNSFYAGYTIEPTRRLEEHNSGLGAKYTRPEKRRPLEMIYTEEFTNKSEAMKQEYAFKQLSRKQKEAYLAGDTDLLS